MQEGKRFVSDTIFGAASGTVTGLAMGKRHHALKERGHPDRPALRQGRCRASDVVTEPTVSLTLGGIPSLT